MTVEVPILTPTEFVAIANQTLDYAFAGSMIEGEVASFKINQGKWVFFDLKDEQTSVSCFMALNQLRVPLADGMKIIAKGTPRLTKMGKFSFTITALKLTGEGSLKKAYQILKQKLTQEGLFDITRKRAVPDDLMRIGVISSTGAAGYADFVKILNARWGGMKVLVAHTQVQGIEAPDQMIRALNYFNERGEVQMIAIVRGGGSADDLACFNDEKLTRAVAASKIPVIAGIGHEVDESLVGLAADVCASTPSNAAELLTRDKCAEIHRMKDNLSGVHSVVLRRLADQNRVNREKVQSVGRAVIQQYINPILQSAEEDRRKIMQKIQEELRFELEHLCHQQKVLQAVNPEMVLERGYAIISGKISPGNVVKITTLKQEVKAEIKEAHERKH